VTLQESVRSFVRLLVCSFASFVVRLFVCVWRSYRRCLRLLLVALVRGFRWLAASVMAIVAFVPCLVYVAFVRDFRLLVRVL